MVCRRHHPHAPPRPFGVWGFANARCTRGRSLGARRRPRRRDGRGKSLTLVRLLPHPARRPGRPPLVTIVARDLRACQGPKWREDSPRALGGRGRAGFDLRCDGASFSLGLLSCVPLCLSPPLASSRSPASLYSLSSLCSRRLLSRIHTVLWCVRVEVGSVFVPAIWHTR
jgi:hypothetical protein